MENLETATFAGGCFWCTEAIFKRLKGVETVLPGYAGGDIDNPSYMAVSSGRTNHAEAIQITFDPQTITYQTLLDVFFATHNPTTKNQQGADVGTQYRSVIFYHSDAQRQQAEATIASLNQSGKYQKPIVTEITPYTNFFKAEDYHQDYYNKNSSAPYCTIVIDPKIKKLLAEFSREVKKEFK